MRVTAIIAGTSFYFDVDGVMRQRTPATAVMRACSGVAGSRGHQVVVASVPDEVTSCTVRRMAMLTCRVAMSLAWDVTIE
jgi:hypothetical protein